MCNQRTALLALLFIGIVAGGCKGPLEMTVAGEPELNGGGNAVIVRIYQLRSDTNFRGATVETFWQDDHAALGNEYVDHRQMLLYPNQVETIPIELNKEARYVGIAADLREPDQDRWRDIFAVGELRGRDVSVSVGSNRLTVAVK